MAAFPDLTWGGGAETQVSAAASIDSDAIATAGTIGFSVAVLVSATAPNGLSGNLELIVSNDGINYAALQGSGVPIQLGAGQEQQVGMSFFAFYNWAKLRWTQAGIGTDGTLGTGEWSVSEAPAPNPPAPAPQPTALAAQPGLVVTSIDRLAQFIRTKPNATAIIAALARRFSDTGGAIQGIWMARQFEQLGSGRYTQTIDEIGEIVGAERPFGASDGTFLNYIRATVAANRSSGRVEDIYSVVAPILPPSFSARIECYAPRSFVLRINGEAGTATDAEGAAPFGNGNSGSALVDAIAFFLRKARLAGVWAVVSYQLDPSADVFTLDTGPGLDAGYLRGWEQ